MLKNKISDIAKKNFRIHHIFSYIRKHISGHTIKFSGYIIFFSEMKKYRFKNIDSSFQKWPLGKKGNLNENFSCKKGHFAPGKRTLGKT